jgi:ATP-dependent RNA helicase DeaD
VSTSATSTNWPETLGVELSEALTKKGFSVLTSVQQAVLDPKLQGRDLRITSQTGSGKTLAIGFALRDFAALKPSVQNGVPKPLALVIAPTRELAKQVEVELSWLYASLGARVTSVTGGASYRDERRALNAAPSVVVGTPGRLLDHLERGSIDPSELKAIALDEADRMLDLGFREDLLAIFAKAPKEHLTHLMSATFPHDVRALADRVQNNPARVEGTPLGEANTDIEHIVHLVDPKQRVDAIVNLLLFTPDSNSLIFARTRADVAQLTRDLRTAGFTVSSLSGEMEQPERNRALSMFKRGDLDALVATDVAARGIDVHDIGMVIQAEPPTDSDSYTHRSGRTGRAGKKGTSHLLVDPHVLNKTAALLKRARVRFRIDPVPTPEQIEAAADQRFLEEMSAENAAETDSELPDRGFDARTWAIAKKLVEQTDPTRLVARFIESARRKAPASPRIVRAIDVKLPEKEAHRRLDKQQSIRDKYDRADKKIPTPRASSRSIPTARASSKSIPTARASAKSVTARASSKDVSKSRISSRDVSEKIPAPRASRSSKETLVHDSPRPARAPRQEPEGGWVSFRVTWGKEHGADARRILAMVCRRGDVDGNQIGAIRIDRHHSIVDVARPVSKSFAEATLPPDPRNPRVRISEERGGSSAGARDAREHRSSAHTGNHPPRRSRER